METLGHILRSARERKNYTTAQVAAATRIKVQIVEGLERDDFSEIPAPIYGKGFVRLYADCVGLDPNPLVAQYIQATGPGTRQAVSGEQIAATAAEQGQAWTPLKRFRAARSLANLNLPDLSLPELLSYLAHWKVLGSLASALVAALLVTAGLRACAAGRPARPPAAPGDFEAPQKLIEPPPPPYVL